MIKTEELKINIGPQHPSTHGVLRLIMTLDGEIIKECEPVIGYLHRGKEKLAESRSYYQYLPMVDRIDYLAGFFNNASFCTAVESIAGISVPAKAEYIRIITMELNRVTSHLLWLGSLLLDLGATSPLFYTFREREDILRLFEQYTGQRMMYNAYCFGGVKKDLPSGWLTEAYELCSNMPRLFNEYEAIITQNPIFLERTKGIGIIDKQTALDFGLTGPNLRASGVDFDARKDSPYGLYKEMDFNVPVLQDGDCYARYLVRMSEMRESLKIVKQAIKKLQDLEKNSPDSEENKIYSKKPNLLAFKPSAGEATSLIESPRGLTACYVVSDGTAKPYRVKWRTGSFSAVQIVPEAVKGRPYSDLMAILGSLDFVLPEVDR